MKHFPPRDGYSLILTEARIQDIRKQRDMLKNGLFLSFGLFLLRKSGQCGAGAFFVGEAGQGKFLISADYPTLRRHYSAVIDIIST